jgi:methyl-accepting chemotaxis protein
MSQTVVEKTTEQISKTTEQIAEATRQASSRAANALGHVIDDGVHVVRRAIKQGGDAAEEFLDDTTKRMERHLVLTVAATLAVGLFSGVVFGWLIKRK